MTIQPSDAQYLAGFQDPLIIAHDVGRSHDRFTAVVGGHLAVRAPRLFGIQTLRSHRRICLAAQVPNELANVDRLHH